MKRRNKSAFDRCVESVAARGGAADPRAVCYTAGVRKYGKAEMTRRAIAGKKRAARRRGNPTVAEHKADFYRQGFAEGKKERGQDYPVLGPSRASGQGEFMARRLVDYYGLPASKAGGVAAEFTRGYFDGFHGKRRGRRNAGRPDYKAQMDAIGAQIDDAMKKRDFKRVRDLQTKGQRLYSKVVGGLRKGAARYRGSRGNAPRVTQRDVDSAAASYHNNLMQYGENNMATQRAEFKYRDLQRAYAEQKAKRAARGNPADAIDLMREGHKEAERLVRDTGVSGKSVGASTANNYFNAWWMQNAQSTDVSKADAKRHWLKGFRGGYGRGNPAEGARAVSEEFHGRKVREMIPVRERRHHHTFLAELGELTLLVIYTPDGRRKVELTNFDGALLCANEEKNQLFVKGGDQSVHLPDFGIRDPHEKEHLGELRKIAYFTDKEHLGDEGGEADYHHSFSKPYPHVDFYTRDTHLEISGGKYKITREGIVG